LTKEEATKRAAVVANVSYKLALALNSGAQSFHGHVTIVFTLNEIVKDLFIDFKGKSVEKLGINGTLVHDEENIFRKHRIYLPSQYLKLG